MKERLVSIISDYINVFIYLFSYYEVIKIVTKFLSGDKTNISKVEKKIKRVWSVF